MPRVILHLGMPRTGSTTLQHVWLRHRDALAELGILYPDLTPAGAAERHINHQHLGEALDATARGGPLEELIGQLDRALRRGADTLILSYEMWAHRRPAAVAPMLDLLRRAGAPAPLVVVKSTAEAANSAYTLRMLFLREARSFAAYAASFGLRFRLDLPARLLPWRAACGSLTAVPLRDLEDGAPLVARVWQAAGIARRAGHLLDPADLTRRENPSAGPVAIEACRRLAATGILRGQGDVAMRAISRAIEAAAAARGADAEPFRGYDAEGAAVLEARWAQRNARFAEVAWGAPWSSRVAPPPPRPVNDLLQTRDAEGLRMVEDVLSETCARFGLPVPGPEPRGLLAGWRRLMRPFPGRKTRDA